MSRAMVRRATARSAPYLTKATPTMASPRRAEEGQVQCQREQGGRQPGELVRLGARLRVRLGLRVRVRVRARLG